MIKALKIDISDTNLANLELNLKKMSNMQLHHIMMHGKTKGTKPDLMLEHTFLA